MITSYFYRCFLYCFLHHIPRPQYDLSKLIPHPVQDALVQAMNNPLCGIYIFWGIQGSGKTAYSSWMAEQLSKKGRHIWHLDSHSLIGRHSAIVMRKICENLPGRERMFQLNPTSPPPTTIVIDNFDQAWPSGNDKHSVVKKLRDIITMLADQSVMGKRFNLMLVISSPELARAVLQWDQLRIQLIETIGIWKREQLEVLLSMTSYTSSTDDREDRLMHCTTAGTPGFVVWGASRKSLKQIEHTAKARKRLSDGIRVLSIFSPVSSDRGGASRSSLLAKHIRIKQNSRYFQCGSCAR